MDNEKIKTVPIQNTELDQITKLLADLVFLINNIADFGLLGLAKDYINQLQTIGKKFSDYGIESASKAVNDFVEGFNTGNFSVMANQLFYISNWHRLYSKKIHILDLKLELKDESILDKAKESIELIEEQNITFVPFTIVIDKVQTKSSSYFLSLHWLGVLLKDKGQEVIALSSFQDECVTTFYYDALYLFYDRLKSKFFINQLVQYNQLINSPISFIKVGTKVHVDNPELVLPYIELHNTVNSKANFSSNFSKEQVTALLENIPGFLLVKFDRNCKIDIDEEALFLKLHADENDYIIQCDNKFLLRQLFILHYTGVSVDLLLLQCSIYYQFSHVNQNTMHSVSEKSSCYHIITINQGGENIVVALQLFNIKLNYFYFFDKIVLKYDETLDNLESYIQYAYYVQNSQLPKAHPKIKSNFSLIENFLNELFQSIEKLDDYLIDSKKLYLLVILADTIKILDQRAKFNILLTKILKIEKKILNITIFKDYLMSIAILVSIGRNNKFLDQPDQQSLTNFSAFFKMKPSSFESLLVNYISGQDSVALDEPISKFIKKTLLKEKFDPDFNEEEKLIIILLKKIFNKKLDVTLFEKKVIELQTLWDILQKTHSVLDPIFFYYLKQI